MCKICILFGEASTSYSFPTGHPLSSLRAEMFGSLLETSGLTHSENVRVCEPVLAEESMILDFHEKEYVDFVKTASKLGFGYLDAGDTPAFRGIFEASSYIGGTTILGLDMIMRGEVEHAFTPIGGLHHARRDRAAGFCVFNDPALAVVRAEKKYGLKRIMYVDMDAHHGDGVCYEFYDDPHLFTADIHEDGRYLYPGTGFENETGSGSASGTKLNIPLAPNAGDEEFKQAFRRVEDFVVQVQPDLILFQCGADGLENDPLTHLRYTIESHKYATEKLHAFAHEFCEGRLLIMGGGGYSAESTATAWLEVIKTILHKDA